MAYASSEIGFIRCDHATIVSAFDAWQRSIFEPRGWSVTREDGHSPAERAVAALVPPSAPIRTRHLFLQTHSEWVAYLDNGKNGTDAASVVAELALRLDVQGVRVVAAAKAGLREPAPAWFRAPEKWPAMMFELKQGGSDLRSLYSANDGGRWVHGEVGNPLPLEGDARRVDRVHPFTIERLDALLVAFGVRAFERDWYKDRWSLFRMDRAPR